MVHDRLHIICGNCGQNLTKDKMATWKYVETDINEKDSSVICPADVYISCNNCATIHSLSQYMEEEK